MEKKIEKNRKNESTVPTKNKREKCRHRYYQIKYFLTDFLLALTKDQINNKYICKNLIKILSIFISYLYYMLFIKIHNNKSTCII
jgi:hypothetical protein